MNERRFRGLVAAWTLVLAAPLAAQEESLDAGPRDGMFSLPRSQDAIAEWQDARAEIKEANYDAAVERLHRLLQRGTFGVLPILGGVDRWEGMRHAVVRTLRELPSDGLDAYERLARRQAGAVFEADPADDTGKRRARWRRSAWKTTSSRRRSRRTARPGRSAAWLRAQPTEFAAVFQPAYPASVGRSSRSASAVRPFSRSTWSCQR